MHFYSRIFLLYFLFLSLGFLFFGVSETKAQDASQKLRWVQTRAGAFAFTLSLDFPEPTFTQPIQISALTLPKLSACTQSHLKGRRVGLWDQVGDVYKEGRKLYSEGKLELAYKYFDQIVQSNKNDTWFIPALFWKANVLIRLKDDDAAQKTLFQVLQSGDANYQFQAQCAQVWSSLQASKLDQALRYLENYVKKDEALLESLEDQELMLFMEYYVHSNMKNYSKAEKLLQGLIQEFKESPRYLKHVLSLAEFYYRLKKWDLLAAFSDELFQAKKLQWEPEIVQVLLMSAQADLERSYWGETAIRLRLLEDWKSQYHEILKLLLFETYLRTSDWTKASMVWSELSEKYKNQSLQRLFYFAFQAKQYAVILNPEFQSYESNWESKRILIIATSQYQSGNAPEAYRSYQKANHAYKYTEPALKQRKVQERILFHQAILEMEARAFSTALLQLYVLVTEYESSKNIQEYYFWYGIALNELNKKGAFIALKQIERNNARADDVLFLRARIYQEQKKWKKALQGFSKLVQEKPKSLFLEESYFFQAALLYDLGRTEDAQASLDQLKSQIHPILNWIRFIHLQARVFDATGKSQLAEKLLQKSLQSYHDYSLLSLRYEILNRMKQHESILEMIANVSSKQFKLTLFQKGELELYRANALYALQRYTEARRVYQNVKKQLPEQKRFVSYQLIQISYALQEQNHKEQEAFRSQASKFVKAAPQDTFVNNVLLHLIQTYRSQKQGKQNQHEIDFYSKQLVQNYQKELKTSTLSPDEQSARILKMAQIYNGLSQYAEAEQVLTQADIAANSELKLRIFKEQGTASFQQKKYQEAIGSYLKVLYLSSQISEKEKFELFKNLAYAYRQLKQEQNAQSILQKMLKELKTPELIQQTQELILEQTKKKTTL